MALTDIFWASGEGDGGGSVSRIYPESHSTNEDVLELVDHWAVTDKTNYHHLLVMSCLQHAIACFFFSSLFRNRIPSFRRQRPSLPPG